MRIKPILAQAATAIAVSTATFWVGVTGVRLHHMTQPGSILTWGLVVGLAAGWIVARNIDRVMDWAHGITTPVILECPDPDCDITIATAQDDGDRLERLRVLACEHALHGQVSRVRINGRSS